MNSHTTISVLTTIFPGEVGLANSPHFSSSICSPNQQCQACNETLLKHQPQPGKITLLPPFFINHQTPEGNGHCSLQARLID